MAQTLEFTESDTFDLGGIEDGEALKDFITDTIMQANEEIFSLATSFSYIAIQRFINHCKNNSIDPLTMAFEDIQKFVDDCLKKELVYEIAKPLTATTPPG